VRCKIDLRADALGNPINHVQIQVKARSSDPAELPVSLTVTNDRTGATATDWERPFIDGSATGEWDSSPDPGVATTLIGSSFVLPGENITASIGVPGVGTKRATCKLKASAMFRQDTKPCKQKDFDRGKCSPVTPPDTSQPRRCRQKDFDRGKCSPVSP